MHTNQMCFIPCTQTKHVLTFNAFAHVCAQTCTVCVRQMLCAVCVALKYGFSATYTAHKPCARTLPRSSPTISATSTLRLIALVSLSIQVAALVRARGLLHALLWVMIKLMLSC
jgi:hypothetical protein